MLGFTANQFRKDINKVSPVVKDVYTNLTPEKVVNGAIKGAKIGIILGKATIKLGIGVAGILVNSAKKTYKNNNKKEEVIIVNS